MKFVHIFLCILLSSPAMGSNADLITDAESLRDSLPVNDHDSRRALTQRLADLIYNEAIDLSAEGVLTARQKSQLKRHRMRAIELYDELLSGNQGRYSKPHGKNKAVIQFQKARIYADMGKIEQSKPIWQQLVKLEQYPDIACESSLWLAENLEIAETASAWKESLRLYDLAIKYSKKHDTQVYAKYRKAWVLRNLDNIDAAIHTMKESLWDAKGQVREEALRDLVRFVAEDGTLVEQRIAYFEQLNDRLNRNDLVEKLGESYFAAGNKPAGVAALLAYTGKEEKLPHLVQLLEETYGLRDWSKFRNVIGKAEKWALKSESESQKQEIEKEMRRLAVQMDADRVTNKDVAYEFGRVADLYLKFFPKSDIRFKMVEGRLGSEQDPEIKVARIEELLANPAFGWKKSEELKLRETAVSIYRLLKDHESATVHLAILAEGAGDTKDRRRFRFVHALELHEQGKVEQAIPLLKELAVENAKDDIGLKSQTLVVDYLSSKKDYTALLASGTVFVNAGNGAHQNKEAYKKMKTVLSNAEFEQAVAGGETAASLKKFKEFCFGGKFMPKSCDNARVLAIKLAAHTDYQEILAFEKKDQKLAEHFEAIGEFAKSAALHEKLLSKNPSDNELLRIALLYELSWRLADRDRFLKKLVSKLSRRKQFASMDEEALYWQTLKDADLLDKNSLKLPWSTSRKCELSEKVASTGMNKSLAKSLLTCTETGPAWNQLVMLKVKKLNDFQKKKTFYGRNSKGRFDRKLKAIKKLGEEINTYFSKALPATQKELASIAASAYSDLSAMILATPIPKGATPEQLAQINSQLQQMAQPFDEKKLEYEDLIAKVQSFDKEPEEVTERIVASQSRDRQLETEQFRALRSTETSGQSIQKLKEHYSVTGNARLAAYFEGRLNGEVQE
jgi:alkylhydroperoxidase/carboxymuconolactone decarboxylase family protein YurZ